MPSAHSAWPVLIVLAGAIYPFLVYFAPPHTPPGLLLVPALAIIALRFCRAADISGNKTIRRLLLAGAVLLLLAMMVPDAAVRAYPAAMSLSAALAFGLSLVRGPSLVERLARRMTPDLPPAGVRYTWCVTLVWCVFLTLNGAVAVATATFGTLAQWTLWNGCGFYIAAGALFGGEFAVRRLVVRQAA